MKTFLLMFILISSAYSQVRPTGNLTDAERVKAFNEIQEMERKVLRSLNTHMARCHQAIKPSASIIEWLATYQLLGTKGAANVPDCTLEEISCLKTFDKNIRGEVFKYVNTEHLKEYLQKQKKMSAVDAELLIQQLKVIFKLQEDKKVKQPDTFNQKS